MKSFLIFLLVVTICLLASSEMVDADTRPPVEGCVLPDIVLATPKSPEHQAYLGLVGKKTFKIPEIKSEVVIIEIFSMY